MEERMTEIFVLCVLIARKIAKQIHVRNRERSGLLLRSAQGLVQLSILLIQPSAEVVFRRLLNGVQLSDHNSGKTMFVLEWYDDSGQEVVNLWLRSTGQLIFQMRFTQSHPAGVVLFRLEEEPVRPIGIEEMEEFLQNVERFLRRTKVGYAA
jgi:hypothetical protein